MLNSEKILLKLLVAFSDASQTSKMELFAKIINGIKLLNILQGWTNFFLGARSASQKMGAQNQNTRPIEAQLKTFPFALYYLNNIYSLHFSSVSIKSFCNEAFVV